MKTPRTTTNNSDNNQEKEYWYDAVTPEQKQQEEKDDSARYWHDALTPEKHENTYKNPLYKKAKPKNETTLPPKPNDLYGMRAFAAIKHNKKTGIQSLIEGVPTAPTHPAIQKIYEESTTAVLKNGTVPYSMSGGRETFRKSLAEDYSNDFNLQGDERLTSSDIIFTTGATEALVMLGTYFDQNLNSSRDAVVLETKPAYLSFEGLSKTSPSIINTMQGVDFSENDNLSKLLVTNESIRKTLVKNELDKPENKDKLKVFYLMNPTNPMGQYIKPEEWMKMIDTFREYPDAMIIMDEAYADVTSQTFVSFMSIAPEDIQERLVILRSTSKSLSLPGERIGVIISKNQKLIEHIDDSHLDTKVSINQAAQYTFTKSVEYLTKNQNNKRYTYESYYEGKLGELEEMLERQGFKNEKADFEQDAGFFRFGGFQKMIGMPMNKEVAELVYGDPNKKIENDIDVYNHILFEYDFAMFSPTSKYGLEGKDCIFRLCVDEPAKFQRLDQILGDINQKIEQQKQVNDSRPRADSISFEGFKDAKETQEKGME